MSERHVGGGSRSGRGGGGTRGGGGGGGGGRGCGGRDQRDGGVGRGRGRDGDGGGGSRYDSGGRRGGGGRGGGGTRGGREGGGRGRGGRDQRDGGVGRGRGRDGGGGGGSRYDSGGGRGGGGGGGGGTRGGGGSGGRGRGGRDQRDGGRGRDGGGGRGSRDDSGGGRSGGRYDSGGGRSTCGDFGRGGGGRGGGGDGVSFGGGRGGGGGGRGPATVDKVLTNIIPASITEHFSFYIYTIDSQDKDGNLIDSRSKRSKMFGEGFWDGLFKDMPKKEKDDWRRAIFYQGSFFYSSREVPGLENLPKILIDNEDGVMTCAGKIFWTTPKELLGATASPTPTKEGEISFDGRRCSMCTKSFPDVESMLQHCRDAGHTPVYASREGQAPEPATVEIFISFVNLALQRALGEKFARWGSEFVDPKSAFVPQDRNGDDLDITIFQAFACSFGIVKLEGGKARLGLTCDLKAKVIRNKTLVEAFYEGQRVGGDLTQTVKDRLRRDWEGQTIIYKNDKKTYDIKDLDWDHSPDSLMVPSKNISHTAYFQSKGITLRYPKAKPMIIALNRRNQTIFLPPELVTGDELDANVRQSLPQDASFKPDARNKAIEEIKAFLIPGGKKGGGDLLPALGIMLESTRLSASARVLPAPKIVAAGIGTPKSATNWASALAKATFNVEPKSVVMLNVILVYHQRLGESAQDVYKRIRDFVNRHQAQYRFGDEPVRSVAAGDRAQHWDAVKRNLVSNVPENVFILDFCFPRGNLDEAYPVVKEMLGCHGYVSQFVNFKTYSHDRPTDPKKSEMILQGVARQILDKCGARLWYIQVPKNLPLPAVFVGVDVFHAPTKYDKKKKQRGRKESVAAIVVEVVHSESGICSTSIFSKTYRRQGGQEHDLGDALKDTLEQAMRLLECQAKSVVVWRDGISESAFSKAAIEEIAGIRDGVKGKGVGKGQAPNIPIAYIVCQKRINTKFMTPDGKSSAPTGTLVSSIQGMQHLTFYINGSAPPYSTAKPVRYIVVERDSQLLEVPIAELTWGQCHNYPNWTGPIKVPSVCQMAHKLAELAGSFNDHGESIRAEAYVNKVYFL